jgi:hypothetical protein
MHHQYKSKNKMGTLMQVWTFKMKCSAFFYTAIILSDNYKLSLPAGSLIVLTAHTWSRILVESHLQQLSDNINTLCFHKVTAFSIYLNDKMALKQANAYKHHTMWLYVMYLAVHVHSRYWIQTSKHCSHPYDVSHISSFQQNGWKMLYHCRRPTHPHLHSQAENKIGNWQQL